MNKMNKNKSNKSISTDMNISLRLPLKSKSNLKKPISIKFPHILSLNYIINNNNIRNNNIKDYYKNPQFLSSSNLQNQINILLTNINNKKKTNNIHRNESFESIKKLPKIKTSNNLEKSTDISYDSTLNYRNQSININKFPNVSSQSDYSINNDFNQKLNDVNFIYKNIFTKSPLFKEKARYIDNKLNMVYCQNESQYKLIMERRNKLNNGSVLKFGEDSEKIKGQVEDIKTKIKFMKNIMDYSYPGFMLTKIKAWGKNISNQKIDDIPTPVEERKNQLKKREILRSNYLKKNFNIFPLKI